jgi:DNA-binding NtrC family response regulator
MTQHILAVDDEPHILKLLERIVEDKTPYRITTTSNSLEVPALLEGQVFDVVVTDLRMPGLDGFGVARLVRERGRGAQVILITAFGGLDAAMEALSAGVFDYVHKPFRKEEFLFSLHRAMCCARTQQEAAQLRGIVEREPYQEARDAFDQEYVRRLQARAPGDLSSQAERSGLDPRRIEEMKHG